MDNWKYIFNLHNLSITEPVENKYIAIVPVTDQRVQIYVKKFPVIHTLINNFSNQFNTKYYPSVLIINSKSPKSVFDVEAIVGFRNALAICSVIKAWASSLVSGMSLSQSVFSNFFDFYPIHPGTDCKYLYTHSPVVTGLNTHSKFKGQSAPELNVPLKGIDYDEDILLKLLSLWTQRFVTGRKTLKTRVLFRSLEMAYQASSIPFKNHSTIYDYGSLLSLWVSAFELLVPSGRNKLTKILELLNYDFTYSNKLKKRLYTISISNRKRRVTLVQKIYYQIHNTRNDFLHGNPVGMNKLYVFNMSDRRILNCYAPLLFEIALMKFLNINYKKGKKIAGISMSKYMKIRNMEKALLTALKERK